MNKKIYLSLGIIFSFFIASSPAFAVDGPLKSCGYILKNDQGVKIGGPYNDRGLTRSMACKNARSICMENLSRHPRGSVFCDLIDLPHSIFLREFFKEDNRHAQVDIDVSAHTRKKGFRCIVLDVEKTRKNTVILNTIPVWGSNRKIIKEINIGHRTNPGENTYCNGNIPRGTTKIRLNLDHGAGSKVKVYLRD